MDCASCGAPLGPGARFCSECGSPAAGSGPGRGDERRLVTVVMADLVGFTALSEFSDPEQVKNLVDRTFERLVADVRAFGGSLDKIVGDQLVATFGVPTAHEDDAERAVRAALQMLTTVAQARREERADLQLRIGVNTGEVLVGAMRAGGESTVMGDVVNAASRLQTSAAPGAILVGPATRSATHHVVDYEAMGELSVRGREEPIAAWRALGASAPPGRRRGLRGPLVGRDDELAALRGVLALGTSRARATTILLLGEAGVGKTRLATELATSAREQHGARVYFGHCAPYGEGQAWGPLVDLLRHACGFTPDDDSVTGRARVEKAVDALLFADDPTERERVVEGILFVVSGQSRPGVDPSRARDDAIRAMGTFLRGLTSQAPLVLALSDAHWADDQVIEAAVRLLRMLRDQPFVLIAAARPGFEERWHPGAVMHHSLVVHLDALAPAAVRTLANAIHGTELSEEMLDFVVERSGGNPFFVEELVALATESPEATEAAALERARGLPATLHGIIAARLDALSPSERTLLEDLAVIGPSGDPDEVRLLVPGCDLETDGARLADRGLIELHEREFRFRSELIREVAYGTLTKAERARRHARFAALLPGPDGRSERVAHHLAAAAELVGEVGAVEGVPDDLTPRAIAALFAAARRAEQGEDFVGAGAFHERVLTLAGHDASEHRWEALVGRARAREAQRLLDAARDDVLQVVEEAREAGPSLVLATALTLHGQIEFDAGALDVAEASFSEAAATARSSGHPSAVADALRWLGMTALFRGEHDQAQHLISDALQVFRAEGETRGEAWALQNLSWIAVSTGRTHEAEGWLQESAARFEEIGDWGGLGWANGMLAFVRFQQGDLDEAEALAAKILPETLELGQLWAASMMQVLLSAVALWRGRSERAAELAREALDTFRSSNDAWGSVQATGNLARALNNLGQFEQCREVLDAAGTDFAAVSDPQMRNVLPRLLRANVALHRGDAESATAALGFTRSDGGATLLDHAEYLGAADAMQAVGHLALQVGVAAQVVEPLAEAWSSATGGSRHSLGAVLALAYTHVGRAEEALGVTDDLGARSGGTYLDALFTQFAAGAAHAQLGNTDAAIAAFGAAVDAAFATDSRLDRAIAALGRALALRHLGAPGAADAEMESSLMWHALGLEPGGWTMLFQRALSPR